MLSKLRVDFNLATSSGLCPASASDLTLTVGERIAVYDTDTDVFLAEVVEANGNDVVVRVHFDKVLAELD